MEQLHLYLHLKEYLNPLVDFKWNLINFDKLTGYAISIIINWTYRLITHIINFTKQKAQSSKVKIKEHKQLKGKVLYISREFIPQLVSWCFQQRHSRFKFVNP